MRTQKEIRIAFWNAHPQFKRKGRTKQNDYPTDVRVCFVDFVEAARRAGDMSELMAYKVTL